MKTKATLVYLGLTVTISAPAAFAHGGHGSFNSCGGFGQSSHSGSGCYQNQPTCTQPQNTTNCSGGSSGGGGSTTSSCYHLPCQPQPVTCVTHHHSDKNCNSPPPPPPAPTAAQLAQEGLQDLQAAQTQFQDARADLRQAHMDQMHANHELALYTRLEKIGNHDVCAGNALCKEGGRYGHLGRILLNEGNACLSRAQGLGSQNKKDQCAANNLKNDAAADIRDGLAELNDGLADLTKANAETPTGAGGLSAGLKAAITDGLENLQMASTLATKAANDVSVANATTTSTQTANADRAAAANMLGRSAFLFTEGGEDIKDAYAGIPDRD